MRRILAKEHVSLLAQMAWANVLLAFDYDGTLSPIVADRDKAGMRPRTAKLFRALCERYPCVVVSGRSQSDVAARLEGAAVKAIVGNHGLEPCNALDVYEAEAAVARAKLAETLAAWVGVDIEDKRFSLAVHYRRSRQKGEAREAILAAVAALPSPMRVVLGKLVVNVVSPHAPNKGDALLQLRAALRADTALYVGDDVTDEDVFKIDQPGRLLSVRVGLSRSTAAPYALRDQREIDTMLQALLDLRSSPERAS